MGRQPRLKRPSLVAILCALVLGAPALGSSGALAEGPILWGYGIKSCREFVAAAPEAGVEAAGNEELLRYREWLAGLVSGLNLATGLDVLEGAELEAALTRIRAHCQDKPQEDFFNASLALVKSLGSAAGKAKK